MSAGARWRLRHPVRTSGPVGPVTVRFMAPAKSGWSLEEARDLLRQGYTVEHVARVTGWAPALIAAGPDRPGTTSGDYSPRSTSPAHLAVL
jgi:hypothetical protein